MFNFIGNNVVELFLLYPMVLCTIIVPNTGCLDESYFVYTLKSVYDLTVVYYKMFS